MLLPITLRTVELVSVLGAPSVAVAAKALVVAVILVKLEVVAASKVLVVLVVAGILIVVVVVDVLPVITAIVAVVVSVFDQLIRDTSRRKKKRELITTLNTKL